MTVKIQNAEVLASKAHKNALARVVRLLADERAQQAGGHDVEITIEAQGTDYGYAWITVSRDIPTLGENNLLRFLESADRWFIHVGPRGALTAKTYPRSLAQFKGKSWCGINIG